MLRGRRAGSRSMTGDTTSRYYDCGVWGVDVEHVAVWLASLDDDSRAQVVAAIRILEEHGPQLGRPLVDSVAASRHRNMKELRLVGPIGAANPVRLRSGAAGDPARGRRQGRELATVVQAEHPSGRRSVR